MEYIKYKLTGALIVAFLFLSACNGGDGSGYWQSYRDYRYIHSQGGEEIRLTRNFLSLYRKNFIINITMQLGALIIYPFSQN